MLGFRLIVSAVQRVNISAVEETGVFERVLGRTALPSVFVLAVVGVIVI